jgi:hypothetical protein
VELYQIKNLLHSKRKISRLKRQPTGWDKIFARYSSNRGSIWRINKELKKTTKITISTSKRLRLDA